MAAASIHLPDLAGFERQIELTHGHCHYRISGPEHGPRLLLIHGATVPGWEFDRLVPRLNQAGYRTIVPDLYGHGYSARPDLDYDYELFVRQLRELQDKLDIDPPVGLLGHSLGSAIAARLATQEPSRYSKIVLAAPLLDFSGGSVTARLLRLPGLGEMMLPVLVKPILMRRRRQRYGPIEDGRWVELFRLQLKIPGFGRALLSMFRCDTLGDQRDSYRRLAELPHEIAVLRGSEDVIMTAPQFNQLKRCLKQAHFEEIEAVPHSMLITHPEILAPRIIDFFADTNQTR